LQGPAQTRVVLPGAQALWLAMPPKPIPALLDRRIGMELLLPLDVSEFGDDEFAI